MKKKETVHSKPLYSNIYGKEIYPVSLNPLTYKPLEYQRKKKYHFSHEKYEMIR